MLDVQNARYVKFFKIGLINFFGYITREQLHIYQVNVLTNSFTIRQIIPAEDGISIDVMKTYPRIYLVVLERARTVFGSSTSRMYYYNSYNYQFLVNNPVRFDVYNPSAVKTFDIFGTPFMGVVNKINQGNFFGFISVFVNKQIDRPGKFIK